MNRFFTSSFLVLCLSTVDSLYAMEKPDISQSRPAAVSYKLPETIDQDQLIKSSVMIQCGASRGTGIAVGDRYFLTAAHVIAAYALDKQNIRCATVNSVESHYFIPVIESYQNAEGRQSYTPNFSGCDLLKKVNLLREHRISQVHLHQDTSFVEVDASPKTAGPVKMMEEYAEALTCGIESCEQYASHGTHAQFLNTENNIPISVRIFGPDIALLECEEPHNLVALEIADPIQEDRTLVHLVGLSGLRYANEDSSKIIGGTVCSLGDKPAFVYIPRIIGQRFKCLPASANGLKMWFNRPFMRVINKQYLMEDEVCPNAPEGFGLIASGDSGAGAIIVQNGQPYVVGVVSNGEIPSGFLGVHNFLLQQDFNIEKIKEYAGGPELLKLYNSSVNAQDRNAKWYIAQGLADVTHLKPWINSVILKK